MQPICKKKWKQRYQSSFKRAMWQYYLMVVLATLLYSVQFVFSKCYQREKGSTFFYSTIFGAIACLASVPFFLILNAGTFEFTWFSFGIACLYSIDLLLCGVVGAKIMSRANLSVYSLFLLLGGMILPIFYGFAIGERLTVFKGIAIVCVLIAMLCTLKKEEGKKTDWLTILLFVLVFVTNGLSGVLTYVHQRSEAEIVSTSGFLLLCNGVRFVLSALLALGMYLFGKHKAPQLLEIQGAKEGAAKKGAGKSWLLAVFVTVGYALVHGTAALLTTIAAIYVDAGVQSTIVTGGCMVLSTVSGLLFGEKITGKTVISLLFALAGTVCILF